MGAPLNLVGLRHGRLLIQSKTDQRASDGSVQWKCLCDCGSLCLVSTNNLRSGDGTISCGCLHSERFHGTVTHGFLRNYLKPAEYRVWSTMRQRCSNPKNAKYPLYGGRGIVVCDRWNDFALFLADMGPRPSPRYSIDRFPNNDGNYEAGNCRWANPKQ